ncbi:unnamed protein product, partial [Nesidiocoris tenuis]
MRKMLQARERVKSNHDDDDENVESLDTARSFATKTPEGREQVREFVNQWPTYASAYFKLLSTGEWDEHEKGELDRIYGPKVQRSGVTLGKSKITFDTRCIYIDGKPYEATPGLFELIFLRNPTNYDSIDFNQYHDIVKQTNVAYHGYDQHRPLNRFGLRWRRLTKDADVSTLPRVVSPSMPLQPPPMALHPQLPPPTLFEIEKGSFKFFRKRTENIFKTYFASDDATRKAYFLACLGDQTYSLLQSLCVPHDPEDDTKFSYTDLADKLSKHLSPVRSIFSSRQAFYSSQQMENETVADDSARIRSQATTCDFGTVLDVVLRDIFVIGLRHEKVKERLYEEDPTDPSFTLMKAIQ